MNGEGGLFKDFFVYRQETDHTCGPAAVRMSLLHIGVDVPEKEIARASLTHPFGTLHWTLINGYGKFASRVGFKVKMREDEPDVMDRITGAVDSGRPVVFIYSVDNDFPPYEKVLHYGVVIGYSPSNQTITFGNPFGKIEETPLEEWWGRFSLLPEYTPSAMLPLIKLGVLAPRTAIFLER